MQTSFIVKGLKFANVLLRHLLHSYADLSVQVAGCVHNAVVAPAIIYFREYQIMLN